MSVAPTGTTLVVVMTWPFGDTTNPDPENEPPSIRHDTLTVQASTRSAMAWISSALAAPETIPITPATASQRIGDLPRTAVPCPIDASVCHHPNGRKRACGCPPGGVSAVATRQREPYNNDTGR